MKKATSYRLPEATLEQIRRLAAERGMTATQVLVVAIDRMAREYADSGVVEVAPSVADLIEPGDARRED